MNVRRRYVNIVERYYVEFDRRIGRNWSDAAAFFLIYRYSNISYEFTFIYHSITKWKISIQILSINFKLKSKNKRVLIVSEIFYFVPL